ncbi:hypothetical protein [Microbacterium suwonense]|uniref:Uncharacterized protein n=1 Tax=Microbacterium suwonense TaxID=683047 RepID=A0ABN6X2N3_9MICO|nr:hypothetical protein [Microbacterium suwonense]BDZ37981.1 hypothetical protein GCM10025863_05950 [Microbacterium suwonense]
MSTSEENGHTQLTRKQLREIRLTGSTPVITEEEAAAASVQQPTTVLPRAAEPVQIAPASAVEEPSAGAPLTRRQMRALEKAREEASAGGSAAGAAEPRAAEPAPVEEVHVEDAPVEQAHVEDPPVEEVSVGDDAVEDGTGEEDTVEDAPVEGGSAEPAAAEELVSGVPEFDPKPASAPRFEATESLTPDAETETGERPMVGAAFGLGIRTDHKSPSSSALFDELLEGDTSTSQHGASTALIFTPSPGAGSLSGPIASTGEMLVTGTYALPDGLGSQGHARGAADGREIDSVLLDGELAPSSSPTPIAASSAISTSRPAGEVIRPPAPDKGNKLMLTLAVVAGGLAIVLATTLVIAFTTGVFG